MKPLWSSGYWISIGVNYELFGKLAFFSKITAQAINFSMENQHISSNENKYNQQHYQLTLGVKL
jgi:hypothetical protein